MYRFLKFLNTLSVFSLLAVMAVTAEEAGIITNATATLVTTSSYDFVDTEYLLGHVVQEHPDPEVNTARMRESWQRMQKAAADADRLLFLPGLVADRERGVVYIWCQATGMQIGAECEFVLVAEHSGHGYESLAFALARAADVRKAMEFIGLTAGRPADYSRMQFWPKGERVIARVHHAVLDTKKESGSPIRSTPIEDWLHEQGRDPASPPAGFVFTGSQYVPDPVDTNQTVFAADTYSPKSIISSYNEPGTLFDVPRQAGKSATYGSFVYQPLEKLAQYYPLVISLEPERRQPPKRVLDLALQVAPAPEKPAASYTDLHYVVRDESGGVLNESERLQDAVVLFKEIVNRGQDPFVSIHFDPALTVSNLVPLCHFLQDLEGQGGIRVEPPPPGQFYYKAFISNPQYRDRANRPSQPWELRIIQAGDAPSATLTRIEEEWDEDKGFSYQEHSYPVSGAADLTKVIQEEASPIRTFFIYAPPGVTYKTLQHFLGSYLDEYPIIYIFPEA